MSFQVINVLTALSAGFVFGSFALHGIPEGAEMFKEYLVAQYTPPCTLHEGRALGEGEVRLAKALRNTCSVQT